MPKHSIYYHKRNKKEQEKAVLMYKQGLSLREVGKLMGKSHQWVKTAVDELDRNLQKV